jgi:hypothetical protein
LCSILKLEFILTEQQSGDMTLETALALLQTAAAESEEESEVSFQLELF